MVTNDPQPYVLAFSPSTRLSAEDAKWESRVTVYAPRPEYDVEPELHYVINSHGTRAFRAHVLARTDGVVSVLNHAKGEIQWFDEATGKALRAPGTPWEGRSPRLVPGDDPEAVRLAHESLVAALSKDVSQAMAAFNDDIHTTTQAALLIAVQRFTDEALRLVNGEHPKEPS